MAEAPSLDRNKGLPARNVIGVAVCDVSLFQPRLIAGQLGLRGTPAYIAIIGATLALLSGVVIRRTHRWWTAHRDRWHSRGDCR